MGASEVDVDRIESLAKRITPYQRMARSGLVSMIVNSILIGVALLTGLTQLLPFNVSVFSYEQTEFAQHVSREAYVLWLIGTLVFTVVLSIWTHYALSQARRWQLFLPTLVIAAGGFFMGAALYTLLFEHAQMLGPGHMVLLVGFFLYMVALSLDNLVLLWRLVWAPREHLPALRDSPYGRFFSFDLVRRIFPLPRLTYYRSFGFLALALFVVASVLLFKGIAKFTSFGGIYGTVYEFRQACVTVGCPAAPPKALDALIAAIALGALFILGSQVAEFLARRIGRADLNGLLRTDLRPPLVFLRAFGDDQVALRRDRKSWLGWFIDFLPRRSNLDELLTDEGSYHGPVVALGNPTDTLPPYGAARGYFQDKDWQAAVEGLLTDASAIVICVDDTDGVWWEVRNMARAGILEKSLLLLHPRFAEQGSSDRIVARIASVLSEAGGAGSLADRVGAALAGAPAGKAPVIGCFVAADGSVRIFRSSSFRTMSYCAVLRLFLADRRAGVAASAAPVPRPQAPAAAAQGAAA